MTKYNIHKDFAFLRFAPNTKQYMIAPMNRLVKWQFNTTKAPDNIDLTSHKIKGYNNGEIEVLVFKPKNIQANAPCLVYFHGGGFFFEALSAHKKAMYEYAEKSGCIIVFPHYRVSLKHSFPTGFEDCYATLKWAKDSAKALGIDTNRIAIGGDSAGGNLAACVAQKNSDTKEVALCFQLLIYPVCDHTLSSDSMKHFTDTPLFNAPSAKLMWDIYLKGMDRTHLPKYISAFQGDSLQGLPAAYIETAEFDCLRDEAILYANKLRKAGVAVELNQTKGTIHAYDVVRTSNITEENVQRRIRTLRHVFHGA